MNIVSKIIEIEADFPIDNVKIENKLSELGINPLRWAIVKVDGRILTISLACGDLC